MTETIDVGVLGATGTVGRSLVELLSDHPWFRVAELAASPGSAGRSYGELSGLGSESTSAVAGLTLKAPEADWGSPLLLSALPRAAAEELEPALAARGHVIVSNASAHRDDATVPLIIPEVNPDHLGLLEAQAERWPGALVTNPNCSAMGLALALTPLERRFGVRSVAVTTLQSLSGAGRSGPLALDMVDNVIPYIAGEEEKLAHEPRKILGRLEDGAVVPAEFSVSPAVHRVPVLHGHLLSVSVELRRPATPDQAAEALATFRGPEEASGLPSAPGRPIVVLDGRDRPQPRLDRDVERGMTVTVGRVRACPVLDLRFSALVHNLVRGAAGAALLNAELCHKLGITARARA